MNKKSISVIKYIILLAIGVVLLWIAFRKVDLPKMIARKNDVVKQNVDGINYLMKKNKIDVFYGVGSFESANKISVKAEGKDVVILETKKTIIATGSKPASLKGIEIDKKRIITWFRLCTYGVKGFCC